MIGPFIGGMAPRADFDPARYNVAVHGNSIWDPTAGNLVLQLAALPPISGRFSIPNAAVAGFNFSDMEDYGDAIDAAFIPGKENFLILGEITNTVFSQQKTGVQAALAAGHCASRFKAVHPWRVIVPLTIPRGDHLGTKYNAITGEVELLAADAYLRAHYKELGIEAIVEMRRPGGPFAFTDPTDPANFPASLWLDWTHPNNVGKGIMAGYVAGDLKLLRR